LELANEQREAKYLAAVSHETFESLMDRFEKEAFFRTQSSLSPSRGLSGSIDDDAVCAICMDGECQNANVILFCDLCNLAVHQVSHSLVDHTYHRIIYRKKKVMYRIFCKVYMHIFHVIFKLHAETFCHCFKTDVFSSLLSMQ